MAAPRKKAQENQHEALMQLKASLKAKEPGQLYLFYGEESYLRTYYLEELRKQLTEGPAEMFNFHRFNDENFSLQALQDAIESFPMMAERSMVQVDDYDITKGGEVERERLAELLSDIPSYCCVVFCYTSPEFKPSTRMGKALKAIENHGLVVQFARQNTRELINWVRRHFMRHKKEIDDRLCEYLIHITGGTMAALASEIEKICTYSESTQILRSDIDTLVEPVLEAATFEIANAVTGGDYALALQKMRTLMQMQEDPIMVLGGIGFSIRQLRAAKVIVSSGRGSESLRALYPKSSSYGLQKTISAVAGISQQFCDKAVLLCTETDYRMKTSYDDKQRLLEMLLLQLAEEARRG